MKVITTLGRIILSIIVVYFPGNVTRSRGAMSDKIEFEEASIQSRSLKRSLPYKDSIVPFDGFEASDKLDETRSLAQSRTQVENPQQPPWRAVAMLEFYNGNILKTRATGFFTKGDLLVTARHNFFLSAPYDAIGITLGFDVNAPAHVTVPAYSQSWYQHRDVGVIVTENIAINPFVPPGGSTVDGILAGYAFGDDYGNPILSAGANKLYLNGQTLSYLIPSHKGDSGAPVFSLTRNMPEVFGIHTALVQGSTPGEYIGQAEYYDGQMIQIIEALEYHARNQQYVGV